MKYLIPVVILFFILSSCKKSDTNDNTPVQPTKTELLTSHVFIYDIAYNNYGLPNQQIIYKKGAPNNITDLSNDRVHYYSDGTYEEWNNSSFVAGTWQFSDTATKIVVSSNAGTNIANIVKLNADTLEWYNPTAHSWGRQIAKK